MPQLRQDHIRELDDLVQQAGASGGLGGVGAREMVAELNERINILMAENTVMADQVQRTTAFMEDIPSGFPWMRLPITVCAFLAMENDPHSWYGSFVRRRNPTG